MLRVAGSKGGSLLLAGVGILVASCVNAHLIDEEDGSVEQSKPPSDDAGGVDAGSPRDSGTSADAATDAGSCVGEAGESNRCDCAGDSDNDGTDDCHDQCPLDSNSSVLLVRYTDCDGDGIPATLSVVACPGELRRVTCQDGAVPDGGWSANPGTDCDDEEASAVEVRDWYPDCDGDGFASVSGVPACGPRAASQAFHCMDGKDPKGGFRSVPGLDCNDEDPSAVAVRDWFADCDGDRVPGSIATNACGLAGANAAFKCAGGQAPALGFTSSAGTDCNDEDPSASVATTWFADCDGDGTNSSVPLISCRSSEVATATFKCADGQAPDGGFSSTVGSDCNDEDPQAVATSSWFADCDGDGVQTSTALQACGLLGAVASTPCRDHQAPDGDFYSVPGSDCDDELSTNPCGCGYQDDDGDGTCTPGNASPRSCLEALMRDPAATDGQYEIDPDGAGSAASFMVTCDMTGGGFTVIARDDFTAGSAMGWTAANATPTPLNTGSNCVAPLGLFLGGYNILGGSGAQTGKTFALLSIPHTEVSVALDYIVLDTWDTENALVYIDGIERYRAAFLHSSASASICGSSRKDYGPQRVNLSFAHSLDSVAVRVTSTLDQAATDESFGVDNVVIRIR